MPNGATMCCGRWRGLGIGVRASVFVGALNNRNFFRREVIKLIRHLVNSVLCSTPSPTSVALRFLMDYLSNRNNAAYIGGPSFVINGGIGESVYNDLIRYA